MLYLYNGRISIVDINFKHCLNLMSNIVKKELTQLEKDVLEVIEVSSISTAKEIADILDVDLQDVIAILNNDDFYNLICANSLGNMRLAYHSKGIPHLISKLDEERHFFDSYDRLTKAIGAVKDRDNESLKVSLEVLLKDAKITKSDSPHTNSDPDLNTVSKAVSKTKTANIFSIEDNGEKQSKTKSAKTDSPHTKGEITFEFDED